MAISLKRYDRQVGVSAQTGTQAISGGLASAMIQEAGMEDQLIGDAIGVLGEAADTFFEHKAKGEVAKYEAYKQDWANQLEVKKQQGLLKGGLKATELYDKVVLPEQRAFEKWVSDQEFSNLAKKEIDIDVPNFSKKINATERLNLIQFQIEENNYNQQQQAESLMYQGYLSKKNGNLEEANKFFNDADIIWNNLSNTTKPGVVDSLKQTANKKYYLSEIRFLNNEYQNQDITFSEFKNSIINLKENLNNDIENGKISGSNIQDINLELDAKIQNAAKQERLSIKTDLKNISKGLFDDEEFIDFNDVRNLYIKNPSIVNYIDNNIIKNLKDYSLVNDNAKKAIELLAKGSKEDGIAFSKILDELNGLGEVGNVTMMLALNYAEQNLDNDEEFIAYTEGVFKKNVTISVTPEFRDYFSTLKYFILDQKQSKYDSFANKKLKEFVEWQSTNEDYESFKEKQFGSFAKEIALKENIFEKTTKTKTVLWDNL